MHLVRFDVCGYKRFDKSAKIDVDGKLVAIVGPNEAGKTSLLEALQHFNHRNSFQRDGASQEITRGKQVDEEQPIAKLTFYIDDEDKYAFSDISEAMDVRWFILQKTINGEITAITSPEIKRDFSLRHEIKQGMLRILEDCHEIDLSELLDILDSKAESLLDNEISIIQNAIYDLESLNTTSESELLNTLVDRLKSLKEYEELDHPEERVRSILMNHIPKFLLFEDSDRNLESLYDINTFFRDKNSIPIPPALKNLADAGQLDLLDLYNARIKKDAGRIETILEKANEKLNEIMQNAWTQAKISVKLRFDSSQFHVLIKSQEGQFDRIADRSDGLRQFVALLFFLSQRSYQEIKPIVLVDEAERHLHYDAQADLVQMFARQDLAAKVIYTTHSIGCLPEDLGSGVRMVVAEDPYSRIENWFWESDRPGFSSLLFGMGANTLAFIPIRYAVIAEGPADMLLLPAMLKEVLKKDFLDFQVVPGLSKSPSEQLAILDNEASRTVFLTDNDGGGRNLKTQLHSAGIPTERIITLPSINEQDTVLEDYLDLNSYMDAVNKELFRSHGGDYQIESAELNTANRPYALEQWCENQKIKPPRKRAVAYHLLEDRHVRCLVDDESKLRIEQLYHDINVALRCCND